MSPVAAPGEGSVVTVGTFDGVHPGHRAVIADVVARARATGRLSVAVTFEPHPLAVVNPSAAPPRLTTAAERIEALATTGVDRVMVLHFDAAMAALSPEAFVVEVLQRRCGMHELVIGHDHGFGKGRQGDVATLQRLGEVHGFTVDVVEPVLPAGDELPVSSSRIRRAIAGGDLDGAARLLGRPYTVLASVTTGERRGRTIGYPTLNLALAPEKLLPPDGVWAVMVETPAGRFGGMMNQGHRPTFDDGRRLLEVHLFDFAGDLYGQWVRVQWLAPLRAIRRFDGVDALRQQLDEDAVRARAVVARGRPDPDARLAAPE
ncbi:MAG TPA: bifunctional riboflavin kinase/FAD synthetase [Gemmatimonadales bacterium]|nr:bifunctional riboflavin kinase/FAD synthetase [Gemmatimonadales bacterium]